MTYYVQMARTEGMQGFYRGFSAVLLGALPGNVCYFGGYELGKRLVTRVDRTIMQAAGTSVADQPVPPGPLSGLLGDMATGMVAQLVAGIAFTPMDIVKERMQVQVGSFTGGLR